MFISISLFNSFFWRQTYMLTWRPSINTVNFPNASVLYEGSVEILPLGNKGTERRKISFWSDIPSIYLAQQLNGSLPYTKLSVNLRSKTRWAKSYEVTSTILYTAGKPASPPRNFRVFWSPVQKVNILMVKTKHWFVKI